MISKETIDKVFEVCIIEDVISSYLPDLKKKGGNYWACCPFHEEKTPSFSVSPAKGIYKCFGCGKGGNSINFVMEIGGFSYPEAIRELAAKYNIEIEEKQLSEQAIKKQNEKDSVSIITEYASTFFQKNLWKEEGEIIAISYLKERGYNESIIKKFELGYSPQQRNALCVQSKKDLYEKEILEKAGLSYSIDDKSFDKFNQRIIFPIHNYSGKVVGFGGRSMNKKQKAKYINSAENPIYHKSHVLYGLYFSKTEINKKNECYIVEGYTDVISMHQAGVCNVVAASGTALSSSQINLIKRLTNNVILLFDSDEAGEQASYKHIDTLLKEGMNIKAVTFPKGEDPDSYSNKLSNKDFIDFLRSHEKDFIEHKIELFLNKNEKISPSEKVENIKSIAKSISVIPDKLLRLEYCKLSSSLLEISENDMLDEISKFQKEGKIVSPQKEFQNTDRSTENTLLEECEKEIIRILLNYGDQELSFENESIKVKNYIYQELEDDNLRFSNDVHKKVYSEYSKLFGKTNASIQKLINHDDKEVQETCVDLLSNRHEISNKWADLHQIVIKDETKNLEKTVDQSILVFKQAYLKDQILNYSRMLDEDDENINSINTLNKLNKGLLKINKLLGRNFN